MNTTTHKPTPEFERFLEWQVTTAVQRQARFAEPARPAYAKYFGVAALVVVSILVGAGGVTAAGRIQANEQMKLLLAQQASEVLVAQMQVDVAKKTAELLKSQAEVGVATLGAAADAALNLQRAELMLKRAALGTEEIGASGRAVQDDLSSPLVGKRDFVTERLLIDTQASGLLVRAAADKLKRVKTRFEVGVATEVELAAAQSEMTRAGWNARNLAVLSEMRRQFVLGKIKAADMKHQRILATTYSELGIAEADLEAAKARYVLLERKAAIGTSGEVDLLKARIEMLTKQQEIAQLKTRIKALEGREQGK